MADCAVEGCPKKGTIPIEYNGEEYDVCLLHFRELHRGEELLLAKSKGG